MGAWPEGLHNVHRGRSPLGHCNCQGVAVLACVQKQCALCGLRCAVCGLWCAVVCGVYCSAWGMQCALVCGVRRAVVCGVRCVECGGFVVVCGVRCMVSVVCGM